MEVQGRFAHLTAKALPCSDSPMAQKKTPPKSAGASSKGNKRKINKTAWIREQSLNLQAKEVVAKAESAGIVLSVAQVYTARATAKKVKGATGAPAKAAKTQAAVPASSKLAGDEQTFRRLALSIGLTKSEACLRELKQLAGL